MINDDDHPPLQLTTIELQTPASRLAYGMVFANQRMPWAPNLALGSWFITGLTLLEDRLSTRSENVFKNSDFINYPVAY